MPFFVKTEIIKKEFISNSNLKKKFIDKHILWIKDLKKAGVNIKSGFLVNEINKPGAGGLLIIEVKTYKDALNIVLEDPMIKNKIVDWKLSEWIDISEE
tara:strand:+ start:919 stop:1215 length:297 start_codon:yes stop_codon:yes gene_type:complete